MPTYIIMYEFHGLINRSLVSSQPRRRVVSPRLRKRVIEMCTAQNALANVAFCSFGTLPRIGACISHLHKVPYFIQSSPEIAAVESALRYSESCILFQNRSLVFLHFGSSQMISCLRIETFRVEVESSISDGVWTKLGKQYT